MSPQARLIVEADGGSRGNPGIAGFGALVRDRLSGEVLAERAEPLGKASNNVAEYSGLIAGLKAAYALAPDADIEVRMDSKLVIEQMAGRWKIKHEDMRRLALEAREVATQISDSGGSVSWTWIPRAQNKDADALSNVGMDGESVDRVLARQAVASAEDSPEPTKPPQSAGAPENARQAARLVLVNADPEHAPHTARAVAHLVGSAPAVLVDSGSAEALACAEQIAAALGDRLKVSLTDGAWKKASCERSGLDTAWERLLSHREITVGLLERAAIRAVLARLLEIPPAMAERLALSPGSLTAIEVSATGEPTIVFVNRT